MTSALPGDWSVDAPDRAVNLDDGTLVEIEGDLVTVRNGDAVAVIPIVRRDGRVLALGHRSARFGAWDEHEALTTGAAALHHLGYSSVVVPE